MDITRALSSLRPGAKWTLNGNTLTGLEWHDEEQTQPSNSEIQAEIIRLQTEYDAKEYQRLRAPEYPPITDYLDAVVKNDTEQMQAYITACQAVKAKYPKPE